MINIGREINNAKIQRKGSITKAQTEALILQKNIMRERDIKLVNLEKDIELAKRDRILKVIEANNKRKEAEVRFERELLQAKSEALIMAIEAGAKSYETKSNGTAKANSIKYKYEAQLELFKALRESANMTTTDLLQYTWMEAMRKSSGGELFVDYKKVPLFAEVASGGDREYVVGNN